MNELNTSEQKASDKIESEGLRLRRKFEEDDITMLFDLFEKLNKLANIEEQENWADLIEPYQGKIQPDMYLELENKPDNLQNAYTIIMYYKNLFFENEEEASNFLEEQKNKKKLQQRREFLKKTGITAAGILAVIIGYRSIKSSFADAPNSIENKLNEIKVNKKEGYFLIDKETHDWYSETWSDISGYEYGELILESEEASSYILETNFSSIQYSEGTGLKVNPFTELETTINSYTLSLRPSELKGGTNVFLQIELEDDKNGSRKIKNQLDFKEFLPTVKNDFDRVRFQKTEAFKNQGSTQ